MKGLGRGSGTVSYTHLDVYKRQEQGKLGGQLKEDSKNELGMLGRQFNQMSQSIVELVNRVQMAEDEKRMLDVYKRQVYALWCISGVCSCGQIRIWFCKSAG